MKSSLTEKWIVCRICLKQPKEVMQTIFDRNEEKDLTRMVLECGGVPIKKYDHFPDKICSKCLRYLRVAYKFRVTCQRSHKHLSRFISAPVVVDRADVGAMPELALELEEVEEIAMKLEPEEALLGIKEEFCDNGEDGVVDVYEPMDEGSEAFEEFDTIDRSDSTLSDDIEYLEEFDDNISTSDEEFLPTTTRASAKKLLGVTASAGKSKQQKQQAQKTAAQLPKMTRMTVIKKERLTGAKRGPKPKKIKETSFICDMCGNIYPTQGRLTEHIKLHKGIKPHECEICGHAFAQTQQLARHMNTHTGNRPYKCSYCPAAFADLSTRNKHHRIHTNERPYVCDVCGKSFTYTNTLKFHKMIHTGEKPHVCDICGKGFQQAYKLRNHKMTHEKKGVKLEKIEVEQLDDNYQEVNVAAAQILEI